MSISRSSITRDSITTSSISVNNISGIIPPSISDVLDLSPHAIYDMSGSSTLYQDAALTTPASNGDPVGGIVDLSGNGFTLEQSGTARPTANIGSDNYISFDGIDDYMTVPSSTANFKFLHDGTGATVVMAIKYGEVDDPGVSMCAISTHVTSGNIGQQLRYIDALNDDRFATSVVNGSGFVIAILEVGAVSPNVNTVQTTTYSTANGMEGFIDNVSVASASNALTPSASNSSYSLHMGMLPNFTNYLSGRIYGCAIFDYELTADQQLTVETYFANKMGINL